MMKEDLSHAETRAVLDLIMDETRAMFDAGLEKEVVFVGVLSKIEIWSKERWEKNGCYDNMDEVAEHMSEFGLSF